MGTILESDNMDVINKASKSMINVVHHLGINRVEVIIKNRFKNRQASKKWKKKLKSIKNQNRLEFFLRFQKWVFSLGRCTSNFFHHSS